MKVCTKCKLEQDVSEYSKNSQQSSGLSPSCKSCAKKHSAAYRLRKGDWLNERKRISRLRNIEEIRRKDRERNRTPERRAYRNSRNRYYLVKERSLGKHFMEETTLIYKVAAYLSKKEGSPYEVDHIIPIKGKSVSGLHVPWNLQIKTQFENRSKGARI